MCCVCLKTQIVFAGKNLSSFSLPFLRLKQQKVNLYGLLTCLPDSPQNAEIELYKPWRPKAFSLFGIIIHVLVISLALFENLCYGSTAIINMLFFSVRGST